jgi:outer membrane protein TolC
VTQRLEAGGEVAHADVIKAQILLEQRRREILDAQLSIDKARIGLAVFIFPDYNEDFSVADDLLSIAPLGSLPDVTAAARATSPDIRAAQTALTQEGVGVSIARSGLLPSLTLDYLYGINANQFAIHNGDEHNLGYSAQATLNIPIWNWGAQRSRVRQAELRRQQAQLGLALTQKEFAANLNSLYRETLTARTQTDSLRTSLDLATESLRLILLRYQAGEVSVLEVVDAQTTLTDARNAYDDGLARYRSAWANIQVVTGNF